ncbi:MAG: glycosyltransferase [Aquabacterium sp.]|jgi:glycosyltransferase involved in cell wall biosynthesis|nr:MAG: glycosyltransferase [Aquabacterium sp.]
MTALPSSLASGAALQPATVVALPRKIRVLHLIHTMAYGGVETAVLNWLRTIDRNRFEVHLVCFANPGNTEKPFVDAAERMGFEVHKIPWSRRKPLLRSARLLAAMLRRWNVDVLHAHNWYADFVVALTARLVKVKTITTAYVWFDYDWKRNLLQWMDAKVLRLFDCVTAHCESTREETLKRGFSPDEVRTLICGFETHRVELTPEVRAERRRDQGVQERETVLVNVARFYPEKAHVFLLETFAQILQRQPDTWLWICGVGPLEEEIQAAVDRLGIRHRIKFLGFVTNLPEVLALADIQIHPAHIEGVPLAICEGLAAALPVVASKVGGLPEILDNGRNGILIDRMEHALFVDAVCRLIMDPALARNYGSRGRHFIENDYSLKTAVARVERTYVELVGAEG